LYGVVRYYFKSKVFYETSLEGNIESKVHDLAYVDWLQFDTPGVSPLEKKTGLMTVRMKYIDCEQIVNVRRIIARCVLAPTKSKANIYFVVEL